MHVLYTIFMSQFCENMAANRFYEIYQTFPYNVYALHWGLCSALRVFSVLTDIVICVGQRRI